MSDLDSSEFVIIRSVPHEVEAAMIVAALEQIGVPARMAGGVISGFRAEAPGEVEVLVRREYADAARTLLQEIDGGDGPIDWSQVDVGEPEDQERSDPDSN
ncbi:MAG: DUF2007 domain-containing protein [Planctomycetaceae bacterium]